MKYIGLTRPSCPLGATKETHYFGSYNCEFKKEKNCGDHPGRPMENESILDKRKPDLGLVLDFEWIEFDR